MPAREVPMRFVTYKTMPSLHAMFVPATIRSLAGCDELAGILEQALRSKLDNRMSSVFFIKM
jgi:hypothetical protein